MEQIGCDQHVLSRTAQELTIGGAYSADGQLHLAAVVVPVCQRCDARLVPATYDIAISLAHDCPSGQLPVWRQPEIRGLQRLPNLAWQLAVFGQCQHCNGLEAILFEWMPPD